LSILGLVDELAPVSVGTVLLFLEALAHFGLVILVGVFPLQLPRPVGERALVSKFTEASHKVLAHFSFKLHSEIAALGAFTSGLSARLLFSQVVAWHGLHLTVVLHFAIPVVSICFESFSVPGRTSG